ncbi:Pr6Pr family membrane protein [Streptomyces gardneri]|uniref:Pr6Pr family membrane protein n=1 Tax=Streptomyces gardneri TaxID=66892 RepID=UPI0006BC18B5|nr:Pr6Pr family membrane protein [Streptomyces gardneri]QPK46484.1 Pr6Pr family membrane protein [Streptomyces gardneri]WRK37872.1 Pr6Pr family membrane protein [Streptomyces venezuelae]CUM40215.1 Integral membrane protein [Streptomyces venezuelae]
MITPRPAGSAAVPAAAVVPPAERRPFAAAFRGLIALCAATGIVIECAHGTVLVVLSFFTIWSNILVAVVLGRGAVRAWSRRPPLPALWTGGALLCISVVGLVFHLVLDNPSSQFNQAAEIARLTGAKAVANQLLHTVTPIGAALDFLLLTLPGALRWRHAAQWLAAPGLYLAFALIRGELISPDAPTRYTYPFLDVTAHGYAGVLVNTVVLGAAFYLLGLAIVGLDRVRPAARLSENRISSQRARGLK